MQLHPNELIHRYRRLRQILERAYVQKSWNSRRIDHIADALCEIERRLSRLGNLSGKSVLRGPEVG